MKVVAIVQARMGSTRFPNKVMKPVVGIPMIELLLSRLARSKKVDQIVVATSVDTRNLPLVNHVRALGYECEQGSENDVLERYVQAAEKHGAESDHTMGVGVSVASVALGATVIEKHFTLNRADGGVDSTFSMEPIEMTQLVTETERAWQSLGSVSYGATEAERKSIVFRRSLYLVQDLKAGDILSRDNVRAIRPGLGLPPKYLDVIVGMAVKRDVTRGTALTWEVI